MSKAKVIVNKMLEGDPDDPHAYLDWLGQKVETGPLEKIRFGAHIHLSDEDMIRDNAREAGIDVDSQAFWDEVERCMAIMESHCLQLLREAGLHVSDEGHDETDARVASVWIDTPEEDRKLALLKAVINWAEGDWPSTTSGTMDYAFGADTTQRIYAATEDAARFIDVTIEFTGTDALVEWSRLNLNEAVKGDPDDPEVFLKSYVPRMMGRLLIEFNVIKPHFPDAPGNWYRERVDGMTLFRYNRVGEMKEIMRQMKAYNRQRGDRAGIDQVTYRYKVPNPQGSSIVRGWLDKLGCPVPVIQWACETNAPIWFWVSVKEFNAYMQMVYPQVKLDPVVEGIDDPDDPETFIKSYQRKYFKLFYGSKFGEGTYVGVYNSVEAAVQAAKERKLRQRARHVWISEEIIPDPALAHDTIDNIIIGSEPTANIYDVLPGYKVALRQVTEGADDPNDDASLDPKQYLDATTGWIDTFLNAGMTPDTSGGHDGQFWKRYECHGFNFLLVVSSRVPRFMIVERNDALYGTNTFRRVFEYPDGDINGFVTEFTALDRLLTKALTSAFDGFPAFDEKIDQLYKQHNRRRQRWLSGKIKEAVDDPEIQRYLDQASPEACKSCGNDLTQRHSVVREYVQNNGLTHELSGHYDAKDSGYENDEQPSANLLAVLTVCPTFNDLCARCGKDPNMPPQQESVDEPEQYLKGNVYTLDELRDKLQNYGLSFPSNGISPWGRWAVIDGFTYWAVYSKDPEKWLPQSYFREQLEQFCKDMGFTVYHIQLFGEYPEGITFKLAVPKMQIDPEAYAPQERRLNDPDFDNQRQAHDTIQRDWLPEGAPMPPEDEPTHYVSTAHTDMKRVIPSLGFNKPDPGHNFGDNHYFFYGHDNNNDFSDRYTLTIHDYPKDGYCIVCGWRRGEASHCTSVSYDELIPYITRLKQMLNTTYRADVQSAIKRAKVQEALDPDDPNVNVERHMSSMMDVGKILEPLGFSLRCPTWKCADPEYVWYERFADGLKWTVIRKSDDEPQNFEVSISRPRKLPGHQLMDYQEVGGFYCHVGELDAKLRQALDKPELWRGMDETLDVPLPPEDEPTPNIEKHAQHVEKVEADAIDSAIANATREFDILVDKRGIDNARRADELAAELGAKWAETAGYPNGSDEFDIVVSAVNNHCGERFPGQWEDYPESDYPFQEALNDPDDPQAFLQHMETDWRKILRDHGFKPQPHSDHLSYSIEYPDRVWGANWPVRIYAGHGWNPEPEFNYQHADPDDPDLDAEDAAYEQWERDHGLAAEINRRNISFPDYIYFQFGREYYRRVEVPTNKLDGFLARLIRGAKKIVGTEHIDHDHPETSDLTTMLWNLAKQIARELQIPLKESLDAPPEDEINPEAYLRHLTDINLTDLYQQYGLDANKAGDYGHGIMELGKPATLVWHGKTHTIEKINLAIHTHPFEQVSSVSIYIRPISNEASWRSLKEVKFRYWTVPVSELRDVVHRMIHEVEGVCLVNDLTWPEMIVQFKEAMKRFRPYRSMVIKKKKVAEGVDDPTPEFMQAAFDVPATLKRMGYERSTREEIPFEWYKVFHRMPTELDIMVEVKRRGVGGEENEADIVYDITVYRYPVNDNPGKQWVPVAYRYERNNKQLERVLLKLEDRIRRNDLRGIRDEVAESVPEPPPEDDPTDVIRSHEQNLLPAELKRLDFGPKPEQGKEWIYGVEMPRYWWNRYQAADGQTHGLYVYFLGGQTPEVRANNWNFDAKSWFQRGGDAPTDSPAQSEAHFCAIVRDLDAAMKRSAADSLSPEQEHEAIEAVLKHHRKWWDDTLDYLINTKGGTVPGRIGPGQPA